MQIEEIIAGIDEELARLHKVKALLGEKRNGFGGRAGASGGPVKRKRTMSAEARAKIAAAQKKRWANQKRAAK